MAEAKTHHIDQLYESEPKSHLDLLSHILDRSDEFVVAWRRKHTDQIRADQSLERFS